MGELSLIRMGGGAPIKYGTFPTTQGAVVDLGGLPKYILLGGKSGTIEVVTRVNPQVGEVAVFCENAVGYSSDYEIRAIFSASGFYVSSVGSKLSGQYSNYFAVM